ncbi:hypothetical protein [Polymorphum gilvum]|uniref:Uncharacterized protein n=1 Tax=Polymorphum gilvum (strain LMG 25793 / CGMCC 1.9160 / SL003B-26A1) TaxID=991905 RepID=F2IZH8_POLGS|nr:hypothetical protein [Polymorphum gilvum]ADZ68601.1 hypothetical protein SL003B_0162 [Polymorphum gilvum SL003B-26A1]
MQEETKKSFDFAAELIRQVLTLSTAVITLTISASNYIFKEAPAEARYLMILAWGLFLAAILFGLLGLMSLTGNLEHPGTENGAPKTPTIYNPASRVLIGASLVGFFAAILVSILFGYAANFCPPATRGCLCRALL